MVDKDAYYDKDAAPLVFFKVPSLSEPLPKTDVERKKKLTVVDPG